MSQVIYCPNYNEICDRAWCRNHRGTCGWTGHSESHIVSKTEAEKRIAAGKEKAHQQDIKNAIQLLLKENYTITKQ